MFTEINELTSVSLLTELAIGHRNSVFEKNFMISEGVKPQAPHGAPPLQLLTSLFICGIKAEFSRKHLRPSVQA